MIKAAIEKICELRKPHFFIDEDADARRVYCDKPLQILTEPEPAQIQVGTLTAVKDYLENDLDGRPVKLIHVVNHAHVALLSELVPETAQRMRYLSAMFSAPSAMLFDRFVPHEHFIIALQACFESTDALKEVLKVVGTIKDEKVSTVADDGTLQRVTVSAGLARVSEADVPNPVTLKPYRTFPEVDQPESEFILRLQPGNPLPAAGLWEADGGAWKNQAIANIKAWLKANVEADIPILA